MDKDSLSTGQFRFEMACFNDYAAEEDIETEELEVLSSFCVIFLNSADENEVEP